MTCDACKVNFCTFCIAQSLRETQCCSSYRHIESQKMLVLVKRLIRELDRIQLSCSSTLCARTLSYNEYEKHIMEACPDRDACVKCQEK